MARDKQIIFSGPMVQALLDGRKTQTRRVMRLYPSIDRKRFTVFPPEAVIELEDGEFRRGVCHYASTSALSGPYHLPYAVGDRLWVREHCATWEGDHLDVVYRADETDQGWSDLSHDARTGAPWKRRTSIHMPRWASRLTLTVTDVRVQRVREISEEDAIAEGIARHGGMFSGYGRQSDVWMTARNSFASLWDDLNAKRGYGWDRNPWVVALTFTVERRNIDAE